MNNYLTSEQIAEFERTGILILRDFYSECDIDAVQRGIYNVIGQVMIRHGVADQRAAYEAQSFDEGYLDLIKVNRAWGGEVYDAVKQIPAFMRLVAHPSHELLFSQLRQGSMPGIAAGGYGIRIDCPFEDKYRAMWHQEYPAQLRSVDGLVFWSPLVKVTEALGPVVLCPESHKLGPLPVFNADPEGAGRTGAYALMIKDEQHYLDQYAKTAPLTSPRDLVIIDFMLLHCSGYNKSDRARWSMQFRYFNFADPIGRSHGWKGSYAAGVDFRDIHPELFYVE
ncbi:phytanoyl-CoA dioxygenase family protein [Pseudomonas sp. WS 5011]|uniref:phytanoyl-CoA dioxygenase family protein n=1 Tax=Pseudomonas sp. WS 5011 TaxID=2717477 RepID=UPI0014741271|nr:phytanoyl-CoA dioxygenase family protein [Pseudomonas sp. WS 5011]NMY52320.1 phytanoyl-CoA dioxygenase family protein [Pseudomonas sp. WS 5011]